MNFGSELGKVWVRRLPKSPNFYAVFVKPKMSNFVIFCLMCLPDAIKPNKIKLNYVLI